jgi:dTDP-glucose 4,6-dehydratase
MNKTIIITGGAGFIGSHVVRLFVEKYPDYRIVNLDALTYAGNLENLKDIEDRPNYIFEKGDITDEEFIFGLFKKYQPDGVIHLAAESHVDRSIADAAPFVRTNVVGTQMLLDAALEAGVERFVQVSTDEVYGSLGPDDPPFTETTCYAPNSPYSASKAGSDHLVRAYFHTYGLPVTTTNCSNNYGPYQHAEKFIPTIIRSCLEQRPIPVYGDGRNIRDWLYVEDHCRGVDTVLRQGRLGEVYNIGGHNEWANIDIVRTICTIMDEKRPEHAPHEQLISFVTDRPGHDRRYAIDARKMQEELGWSPAESFETGIHKTVDWYLGTQKI